MRAGFDVSLDGYSADKRTYADPEDPDTIRFDNLFPPRTDQAAGVWADVVWQVAPRLELTPGLRVDVYGSGGASAFALDPRIAARFKITDRFRIVHAYGIAHQPPSFVVPIPGPRSRVSCGAVCSRPGKPPPVSSWIYRAKLAPRPRCFTMRSST